MRIESIDFPTDMYGELGNLRESLVKALNQADSSVSGAKVLASTLAFAASKLREIYREDGIKSKAQEAREARAAKKALKAQVDAARKKLIKDKNPQLLSVMNAKAKSKPKDKVQRSKRTAKK